MYILIKLIGAINKMYYEQAFIKRYKKQSKYKNKNNEIIKKEIEQVTTKGIKKSSKFKDNQAIIIMDLKEFQNLENELNNLREQNNKLNNELNNNLNNVLNNKDNKSQNKLIELLEIINNRNELLINANEQFNLIIDNIINELTSQFINLIQEQNQENKKQLELLINNANGIYETNNIINVNAINKELELINNEFNNIGFFKLYRKRKDINIKLDCLEKIQEQKNIFKDLENINFMLDPNLINGLNIGAIKENAKNNINFLDLYIKFDSNKRFIDL